MPIIELQSYDSSIKTLPNKFKRLSYTFIFMYGIHNGLSYIGNLKKKGLNHINPREAEKGGGAELQEMFWEGGGEGVGSSVPQTLILFQTWFLQSIPVFRLSVQNG